MVSGPAALLARAMNLKAGSYTLDAACASSLVALKLACEHLLTGRADAMVTGGVSRPDCLYTQIGFTQPGGVVTVRTVRPVRPGADGLVVGEGCGILVLKRLEDALNCGDTIHGVIRGWGVSNDIDGNLVAPASEGQVRAMAAAYDMAGLTPARLQYMECHGSGTPVGDKVELASIRAVLDRCGCMGTPLSIGSVKSNIGHLLTAAGAAGIIKTLLAMNRQTLPPSCNFTALPDGNPLDGTQVQVQSRTADWASQESGEPRRAAISAFGFGGINAHILVEEYPGSRSYPVTSGTLPLPTSNTASARPKNPDMFAIVGMEVLTGDCADLNQFTDRILGRAPPGVETGRNPMAADRSPVFLSNRGQGRILDTLSVAMDEFHIPRFRFRTSFPSTWCSSKQSKERWPMPGSLPGPHSGKACEPGPGVPWALILTSEPQIFPCGGMPMAWMTPGRISCPPH